MRRRVAVVARARRGAHGSRVGEHMREEWRCVVGWEGLYEVSSHGRVKSMNFRRKGRPGIVSLKLKRGGYLQASLCRNGERHYRLVHHLVLEAFSGPRPRGAQGRHLNGDPGDNRARNLAWGTVRQNHHDKIWHGTFGAKLKPEQVVELRDAIEAGVSATELAVRYGVAEGTVYRIARGELWRRIGGPLQPKKAKHGRRMSTGQIEAMRRSMAEGLTVAQVAKRHGVSPTTARKHTHT